VVCLLKDEEMAMLGEVTHLQTISDDLKALTCDPHKLPPASEQVRGTTTTQHLNENALEATGGINVSPMQVIMDLKGSDFHWSYQTPPSSPSAAMSRKSSMCR